MARLAFALALVAQFVALYSPSAPAGPPVPDFDKLVHFGLFFAVALFGRWAGIPARVLLVALVVQAGVSEAVQGTLLDRDADPLDSLTDVAGTIVGLLAAGWLSHRLGRRTRSRRPSRKRRPDPCG